eukprot:2407410-Pyramimonas_sp.AAC.1
MFCCVADTASHASGVSRTSPAYSIPRRDHTYPLASTPSSLRSGGAYLFRRGLEASAHCLLSTVYRLPCTVYRVPSTVH